MEFRNIDTFLRVAELKSFTRAAEDLGYAQSTVTVQIHQLEEELGVALFERINKTVSLTPAGEKLMELATEMVVLENRIDQIAKVTNTPQGELRIGVPESLLTNYLVTHIKSYCERFPEVRLKVHAGSSPDLISMLNQNDLDMALVLGEYEIDSNLVVDSSRTDYLVFVTYAGNPLLQMQDITFEEVMGQPLLVTDPGSSYRKVLESCASRRHCQVTPMVQSNETSLLTRLLRNKMGIAYLPRYVVTSYLRSGEIRQLEITNLEDQPMVIHLVHHHGKVVTPQMRGFIHLFQETFDQAIER